VRQLHLSGRAAWRAWLEKNHATEPGVWLVFQKLHTGKTSVSYEAAVEEALCFGWIDSIIKRLDANRYLRKFTPRSSTGHWSAANLERIGRLKRDGRMTEVGLAKLEKGVQAYVPLTRRRLAVPADLRQALARDAKARENFERLAPSYRRHYVAWIATAKKAETRTRRLREAVALLAKHQKLGMK
jgi:uncharacterized protein YdeI (YjbR/CyaY-like superfamily)